VFILLKFYENLASATGFNKDFTILWKVAYFLVLLCIIQVGYIFSETTIAD